MMAETPDHITITVDETALRKQVEGVVQQSLREASWALRNAADALDPSYMQNLFDEQQAYWRARWDAERATEAENRSE